MVRFLLSLPAFHKVASTTVAVQEGLRPSVSRPIVRENLIVLLLLLDYRQKPEHEQEHEHEYEHEWK